MEQLVGGSYKALTEKPFQNELRQYYETLKFIESVQSIDKIQARLPYTLSIE